MIKSLSTTTLSGKTETYKLEWDDQLSGETTKTTLQRVFKDSNNNDVCDEGEEIDWTSFTQKYHIPEDARPEFAACFIQHIEDLKTQVSGLVATQPINCSALRVIVSEVYVAAHGMSMSDTAVRSALHFLDPYVDNCTDCSGHSFDFSAQSNACITGGGLR